MTARFSFRLVLSLTAATLVCAASAVQADPVALLNGDFEATTQSAFPAGFDNNGGYDTPGWQDLTAITDAGVEGSAAWWGTYSGYSAFMAAGNGAFHMSSHVIQPGDQFKVEFVGKSWDNSSQWTAELFYDDPANVLGSLVADVNGDWTTFNSSAIAATAASVGGTLGVSFTNTGSGFANLDNVSLSTVPEPASLALLGLIGIAAVTRRR